MTSTATGPPARRDDERGQTGPGADSPTRDCTTGGDAADASATPAGALWSGWRWPAALGSMAAAATHLPVLPEHVRQAPYVGVAFAAFALVALGAAAGLLLGDTPRRYLLLAGVHLAAVVALVATRLVAFPQLEGEVGNWSELWAVLSAAAELLTEGCCGAALWPGRAYARR